MLATKSVHQGHSSAVLQDLLSQSLLLTYNCIHYGETKGIRNKKGMKEFYHSLKGVDIPSYYKTAAISRGCEVLKSREKSIRRGKQSKHRKPLRPMICITGGFFVTAKGRLFVSLGHEKYEDIQLNRYVQAKLRTEDVKVRSLTITPSSISFCYSKELEPIPIKTVYGVDRNEKNLAYGREENVQTESTSKIVGVKRATREIVGSFKRDDVRVRRRISRKYWGRADNRCNQVLHDATNRIVEAAKENQAALALEDITGINLMYRRGNRKGRAYRFRMNQWPYGRALQMIKYKAAWEGVTAIQLTRAETRGTTIVHFACGEKLRRPEKGDAVHRRMLWCEGCRAWVDRDENASVNLSKRGLARLASSHPGKASNPSVPEEGPAGEAVNGNLLRGPPSAATPGADASKCG